MCADERDEQSRRDVHLLYLEELKNLQTIVLDMEELKHLLCIAKRPRVRSLLSSEITKLHAKVLSNSTVSQEKPEKSPDQDAAQLNNMQKQEVLPDSTEQSASLDHSDFDQEESREVRHRTDGAPPAHRGENSNMLAISHRSRKIYKNKGQDKKGKPLKGNGKGGAQVSTSKGKKKRSPTPDTECFYCHEKGHFLANCPKYKDDLDNGKIERKRPKVSKGTKE